MSTNSKAKKDTNSIWLDQKLNFDIKQNIHKTEKNILSCYLDFK